MKDKVKKIIKGKSKNFFLNNEIEFFNDKIYIREGFDKTLMELTKIFHDLGGWCIIKIKKIPKSHSDVDVLIDPTKFDTFQKRLLDNGYTLLKNYDNRDFNFYKREYNFLVDIQKGNYHTSIMQIDYVEWEHILKNAIIKKIGKIKFKYPCNEDDFLIFSAHSFFSNDTTRYLH